METSEINLATCSKLDFLKEKLKNFKKFVKDIADRNNQTNHYIDKLMTTDDETLILLFSHQFKSGSLSGYVDTMQWESLYGSTIQVKDEERTKLIRYIKCFQEILTEA